MTFKKILNRRTFLLALLIVAAIVSVLPYVRPDLFRRQEPGTSGIYGRYLAEQWAQKNTGASPQ